jgi:sulfate permease, SulP family
MAFLESAAVARSIRRPSEPQIDSDQELFATGAASVVGAFFSTMPAAGGFSQSAVNQSAGARTQVSSLVTVGLALLVALFLGPVLSLLPQATLAAMVFVAVVGLIEIPTLVSWWSLSRTDFWIAAVVAVFGLTAGLLPAVAVGVVVTLVLVLRELNTPKLSVVGRMDGAVAIHLGRGLYTANALTNERAIVQLVTEQPADPVPVDALVLDLARMEILSVTVLEALKDLERELAAIGVVLHLAGLPKRSRTTAEKTAWYRGLRASGRAHRTVHEGLVVAASAS